MTTKKANEKTAATGKKAKAFTAEERAAMKERAKEEKAEKDREAGEADVLAKIAEMEGSDRVLAEGIHKIMKAHAPELAPKTWYGMPAYVKDGNIICFYQPAQKFKAHYGTLGFNDAAKLDDGNMWPVYFALTEITAAEEKKIIALVKKAIS